MVPGKGKMVRPPLIVKPPFLGFLPLEFFDSMKRRQMMTPGALIFLILAVSPIVIWLSHDPGSVRDPWIAAAKTCAFMAISTLSVNYILAARWSVLEGMFKGLDRMYRVHKAMGRSSLIFMVLHPIFLGISKAPDWNTIYGYILPIGPLDVSLGVVALYLFILLIALTVAIRLSYHMWHISHKFLGPVLVLSLLHAIFAGSDMGNYPILRYWIILLSVAGLLSYLYMLIFYKLLGPRYRVEVTRVDHLANITEVHVDKPKGFRYQPGQYIFIRFPRFEGIKELFPFSISNDPCQKDIRISIRRSGDYTSEKIPLVKKGDKVIIMGPYGKFGEKYLHHKKDMVWLAGGIGITPFLSLAKHESLFPTGRKIQLIWVFRDPKDPVHDSELFSEARKNPKFDYVHWISSQKGQLGADDISGIIGGDEELRRRVIMMCGPPRMVTKAAKDLHRRGIPYKNMLFEDFNMLD